MIPYRFADLQLKAFDRLQNYILGLQFYAAKQPQPSQSDYTKVLPVQKFQTHQ
jgi:hypothetical protein